MDGFDGMAGWLTMKVLTSALATEVVGAGAGVWAMICTLGKRSSRSRPSHSDSEAEVGSLVVCTGEAGAKGRMSRGLYLASKCWRKRACKCSLEALSEGFDEVASSKSARPLRFPRIVAMFGVVVEWVDCLQRKSAYKV